MLFGFQSSAVAQGFYFGGGIFRSDPTYEALAETGATPAAFLGSNCIESNIFMLSAELGYYDPGDHGKDGVDVEADAYTLAAGNSAQSRSGLRTFARKVQRPLSAMAHRPDAA